MALWQDDRPLVLASNSAARRHMLEAAGIPLEIKPASIDERGIEAKSGLNDARALAVLLAQEKAHAISRQMPERLVLGADQTLSLGDKRFSKPLGRDDARKQLHALAGQTHELHSVCALVHDGRTIFEFADTALMTMRPLNDDFITRYLDAAGSAVNASVGAYQIEGAGIHLFERIEGDYFTILGLPLLPTLDALRRGGQLVE